MTSNPADPSAPPCDYDRVRALLAGEATRRSRAPLRDGPDEGAPGLAPLLERWGGLTPAAFREAAGPDHARTLVARAAAALDGRAADPGPMLAVRATPPEMGRSGGAGLALACGFHASPFGEAVIVAADGAVVGLGFVEAGDRSAALADMRRRWPRASFAPAPEATAPLARLAFDPQAWRTGAPLPVLLVGTAFDTAVWTALTRIPMGRATTYATLAAHLGRPTAARAVGTAVGRNPVSFLVPCHRVLGRDGSLTGYHWGVTRKQLMLAWEAGRAGPGGRA